MFGNFNIFNRQDTWLSKINDVSLGSSLHSSKLQKNHRSATANSLTQDQHELAAAIRSIQTGILSYTEFFGQIVEISEGVFDFAERDRLPKAAKSFKERLRSATQKKQEFEANPANQLKPEFHELRLWIELGLSILAAKPEQIIETSNVLRLLNVENSEGMLPIVTLRVERWVQGAKGMYTIPDRFLTFYYAQLIESKNPENDRLKVLTQVVKSRYAKQGEFNLVLIEGDKEYVYKRCTIDQVPFRDKLGQVTEDLPTVGTFRPDTPSFYFTQTLPREISEAAQNHLDALRIELGTFFTASSIYGCADHYPVIQKRLACLLSSLGDNQPIDILTQEMLFYYHMALTDPKSSITFNTDTVLQIDCPFYPLVIGLKAIIFNEEITGFREFFVLKLEEWVQSKCSPLTLQQHHITEIADMRRIPITFHFGDYSFELTLENYLLGCEEMRGDNNLIAFCINDTLSKQAPEKARPVKVLSNRGIENIGNSCYLNSVVQALFSLPCITDTLDDSFVRQAKQKIAQLEAAAHKPRLLVEKIEWLKKLIRLHEVTIEVYGRLNSNADMLTVMKEYRATLFEMDSSGLRGQALGGMQDALGVAGCVMEAAGFEVATKITLRGLFNNSVYESTPNPEPTQIFSLPVIQHNDDPATVEHPIDLKSRLDYFMNTPVVSAKDEDHWKPVEGNPAIKIANWTEERKITDNIPPVISIQLKRFDNQLKKVSRRITFPQDDVLDMTPYIERGLLHSENQKVLYRLKAIVIHVGPNLRGGHYYAEAKRNNQWFRFNDDKVTKLASDQISRESAYLAFFERYEPGPQIDID